MEVALRNQAVVDNQKWIELVCGFQGILVEQKGSCASKVPLLLCAAQSYCCKIYNLLLSFMIFGQTFRTVSSVGEVLSVLEWYSPLFVDFRLVKDFRE